MGPGVNIEWKRAVRNSAITVVKRGFARFGCSRRYREEGYVRFVGDSMVVSYAPVSACITIVDRGVRGNGRHYKTGLNRQVADSCGCETVTHLVNAFAG